MNKIVSLVAVVVAFIVGCAADPNENETDVENGGSGGQAGAPAVVGGGGCNEGGSGGEVGQAGAGGEAGAEPAKSFKFDCTDVSDGHFVVKLQMPKGAPVPNAYLTLDGMRDYPDNTGFKDCGWCNMYVAKDKAAANTVFDDGKVPAGSRYMLCPGTSQTGETYKTGNGEDVAGTAWFCQDFKCSIDLLCCAGSKEIGRYQDGKSTGKLAWNAQDQWSPAGKHPFCVVE